MIYIRKVIIFNVSYNFNIMLSTDASTSSDRRLSFCNKFSTLKLNDYKNLW